MRGSLVASQYCSDKGDTRWQVQRWHASQNVQVPAHDTVPLPSGVVAAPPCTRLQHRLNDVEPGPVLIPVIRHVVRPQPARGRLAGEDVINIRRDLRRDVRVAGLVRQRHHAVEEVGTTLVQTPVARPAQPDRLLDIRPEVEQEACGGRLIGRHRLGEEEGEGRLIGRETSRGY